MKIGQHFFNLAERGIQSTRKNVLSRERRWRRKRKK